MIIDIHAHPTFTDFLQEGHAPSTPWPANRKLDIVADPSKMGIAMQLTSKQYKGQEPVMLSVEGMQKHLNKSHDLINFLCPLTKGQSARESNEKAAQLIKQFQGKAIGFAGFDPSSKDPVGDIEYAINELGFNGLKIIPSILGLDINDKRFYPCYEKAQELEVPITIHTGAGLIMGCRIKHVRPILIDDVAFDFPGLKIIAAHLGCWDFMDVHSLLVRHPNVYSDLSAWPLDARYTNLVPWTLFEQTVKDKLLLGSDYPAAQTPQSALESVKGLPISDDFKSKIIGENAAKLLGLE
jgi:predicted TIM-barrel fold metal-dependent hydrolase